MQKIFIINSMKYLIISLIVGLTLSANRVSVHDPSIVKDNGKYYVFGSHIATAKSSDLINWTLMSGDYQNPSNNPVYGNLQTTFKESFKWAGYNEGDNAGGKYGIWAPDVFYNKDYAWSDGSKGAYMLYYSTSSTWRRSCIGFLVSKRIENGYQYRKTILYSGFTNTGRVNYDGASTIDTTYTKSYLNIKTLMDQGKIDRDVSKWKVFNRDGTWNNNYAPNCIDPTLFLDSSGTRLFMTYGSWSGGIFILELDKRTGEPLYPGKDGIESSSGNVIDRYFGVHIAGGNHQSGEGPYIKHDKNSGFYWLYETYGGLFHDGGYNMRLFRSKHLYGPYLDPAGNQAQNSGANCYKYGVKLIGNYQFSGQPAYRSAGHNSFLITDDGNYFLVFHQRFSNKAEYHEVRVRQQFLNEDNWLVTAVYEYKNEKISHYSEADVIGSYELINHGNAEKDGNMLPTQRITLEKGGNVSGAMTGTWTMTNGPSYCYVLFKLNGVNYRGVFFRQTNDNGVKKMTFTAIGKNNLNLWGSSTFTSVATTTPTITPTPTPTPTPSIAITTTWPKASTTKSLTSPITVKAGETYDGYALNGNKWVRYDRGRANLGDCGSLTGNKNDAVFILEKGATLRNVILGPNSVKHVHCISEGCTLQNVFWEDVCVDALTLEGGKNTGSKFVVNGGAAKEARDIVIRHNSAGTLNINTFSVENSGRLYLSCPNCSTGYQGRRDVVMTDVVATNVKSYLAGINKNYGDTVTLKNTKITGGVSCRLYTGNNNGGSPKALGNQCDTNLVYSCVCS